MTEEAQAAQDDNLPPESEAEKLENQAPESTEEPAPSPAVDTSEEVQETDNFQKRINKVTADKYAEKRRADELERKLAEMQTTIPAQPQAESKPTLEQFDFDEDAHRAALVKYEVEQATQAIQKQQAEQQTAQRQQATQASFNSKVAELTEKAPDYAEIVGQLPELPGDTLGAIMEADNGPQLAYYLGKHLDIADEIASASPMMAAMKLGQISASLGSKKTETKTSAAPDPIEPVGSSGSLNKPVEEMSMEEIYNM